MPRIEIEVWVCIHHREDGRVQVYDQPFARHQAEAFVAQAQRFGKTYSIVKTKVALDPDTSPTPDATP
jgi:hypothetical protein